MFFDTVSKAHFAFLIRYFFESKLQTIHDKSIFQIFEIHKFIQGLTTKTILIYKSNSIFTAGGQVVSHGCSTKVW